MGEAGVAGGRLVMRNLEQTKVYVVVTDTEEEKVALTVSKNEGKGKLQMDPLIETS